MKSPLQMLILEEGGAIPFHRIAAYCIVGERLKITVKTDNGEYSVYLYDALAHEKLVTLRQALPRHEQRPGS